jgi:hypothetical protein
MKKGTFAFGLLFLFLFMSGQEIQEKATAVNIEVPVRVYDGNKFVDNLTINDFIIYEDGKKQDIDAVYLIKERAIERKERAEKEEDLVRKEAEEKFAPPGTKDFCVRLRASGVSAPDQWSHRLFFP